MARATDKVVATQRKLQLEQRKRDAATNHTAHDDGARQGQPVQAGQRAHAAAHPPQQLPKPGLESQMQQKPQFEAPDYRGSGKLDVLVNNAAFQLHAQSIDELSDQRFDKTLRTNVYGYFQMARAALPHLGRGSSIINTGSVTGLEGSWHLLDYATTKGAIHAFTKSLAQNVLHKGIRVNAVAPGPVWTPLNPADAPAKRVAKFGQSTDMKRAAQPEELSPAYVVLAAPSCSSYITGIVLPVTGSIGAE